jgi:hypothetical protein
VSISFIFYEQFFHTKVFYAAFMCFQFGFVIFWQKDFGAKAVHKMLVKLTPGCRHKKIFVVSSRNELLKILEKCSIPYFLPLQPSFPVRSYATYAKISPDVNLIKLF